MVDDLKWLGYILFGIYVLTSLWLLLNGLVQLHLLWHYKRKKKDLAQPPFSIARPFVSIQVPVYNEKYVIERLLHALSALDYPTSKFEIQVLDDSTDETSAIIDQKVKDLKQANINISVIRRKDRNGYKAGALQVGLPHCKGDLIAIFDADFIPTPQFLNHMVPHFSDPKTGLVQARWSHLNREQNALTRIQTILLDTHFSVEQTGRAKAGYFINFCGTAGIWRRQCIMDAGGWDGDVLSEDLDLSYRAQLKGWQLVYKQDVEVPAELPSVIEAFKVQQFRWTKGMAQITKKTMRHLLQATLPLSQKLHGMFHLLSSFVFVCLFINALLTVPLLLFRNLYPEFITLTQYSLFTGINLIALTLFYYHGAQSTTDKPLSFFKHYPLFVIVYMGMSVQNAIAVLQGLWGMRSPFVRTPKFNTDNNNTAYLKKSRSWIHYFEMGVFGYFIAGIGLSVFFNDYFMLLFFVMISAGLGYIIFQSFQPVAGGKVVPADAPVWYQKAG